MKNWLTKKISPFIITSIFVVFGFGFFVNTSSAAPHVAPPGSPAEDLLNYPSLVSLLEYRMNIPSGTLTEEIKELDDGLYRNDTEEGSTVEIYEYDYPIEPTQIEKIVTNIIKDGAVSSALRTYYSSFNTWQTLDDECTRAYAPSDCYAAASIDATSAFSSYSAEDLVDMLDEARTALEESEWALALAVPEARERQQGLIDSFVATNAAQALRMLTGNMVTTGEEKVNSAYSDLEGKDLDNQAPITGVPLSEAEIQARKAQQQDIVSKLTDDTLANRMQEECSLGLIPGGPDMNLTACFANIIYNTVYRTTMYALMGSGYIFDKILGLSIDSSFVNQPFVNSSWMVIRDFSNMLFIFILLYTGIMTIFGETNWRKTILQVVFIALIINFSLFFTKVIIDAGNVLAVGVKSAISSGGSISQGLAAGFQPQKFVSYATASGDTSGGDAIVVFLISATVTGFAAYIFFKAALLFLGRLIAFWFLMIFSPFAFISTALPMGNKFQSWLHTLMAQAFVAPVYLFFIYLIMMVISADGGIMSKFNQEGAGWFNSLIGPVIVATLIIVALQKALAFAEGMAGDFGKIGSDLAGKAMGVATVVATGGAGIAGMAGRKFIGGAAARELEKGVDASGNKLTDARRATLEARTKSSFDVRNIVDKNSMFSKVTSGKVFKSDYGVGGVEKVEKDRIQAELKAAEGSKMGVAEQQGVYARANAEAAKKIAGQPAEIEAAKITAEAAANFTAQLKAQADAEKKVDDDSSAAVESAKANYEAVMKNGTVAQKEAAKEAYEKAETTHATSGSSVALQSTLAKLEEARKAEKVAVEALTTATNKTANDYAKEAVTEANTAIAKENKNRMNTRANEARDKGDHAVAAKIRAEEKAGAKTPEEKLEVALKEIKEAREKEAAKEASKP